MTKPTSRCIDIRQEHPLLEKFKEWFRNFYFAGEVWAFWGYDDKYKEWYKDDRLIPEIITLDQRRERRGKEYYEGKHDLHECDRCGKTIGRNNCE